MACVPRPTTVLAAPFPRLGCLYIAFEGAPLPWATSTLTSPFTTFCTWERLLSHRLSALVVGHPPPYYLQPILRIERPQSTQLARMLASFMSLLAAASMVAAQTSTMSFTPAPQVTDEPVGAKYIAMLPNKTGSALSGSIEGTTSTDGKGVQFDVSFSGLPATGGPFIYHIHAKPVPTNGNCSGTGAHLDPYMRGEAPPCDASKPETCQVGDLSGKHGSIAGQSFSASYDDLYLSTNPSDPSFFGNLSFVIHLANKTRIGCANFTMVSGGAGDVPTSTYASMLPTSTSSDDDDDDDCSEPTGFSNATATTSLTGAPIAPSSTSNSTLPESNAAGKVASGAGLVLAAAAAAALVL